MKKYVKTGMPAVCALLVAGLTACSNEPQQPNNPDFDGENVKTQLAISLGKGTQTRQLADDVQANNGTTNNKFRGVEQIHLATLFSYTRGESNEIQSVIGLESLEKEAISASQSSKVYNNISIPVSTRNFLFYGVAKREQTEDNVENNLKYGKTISHFDAVTNTDNISFESVPIDGAGTAFSENNEDAKLLLDIMNALVSIEGWQSDSDLGEAYTMFISDGKYGAGSAAAVATRVADVYNLVVSGANAGGDDVKSQLKAKIDEYFQVEEVKETNPAEGKEPVTLQHKLTFKNESVRTFPAKYGLPDGAAVLAWNSTSSKFEYKNDGRFGDQESTINVVPSTDFIYPAELNYFLATDLKASNTPVEDSAWSNTVSAWISNPVSSINDWQEVVAATTRTIALKDNINYGVAQLQTTVKLAADALPATDLNKRETQVTVKDNKLTWTAILVGGQPSNLDYQFLPKEETGEQAFKRVVYDRIEGTSAAPIYPTSANQSTPNYTLLYDNYTAEERDVMIALEFVNNTGVDFHGVDGVVKDGMKFYLVGKLSKESLSDMTAKFTSATNLNASYFPQHGQGRVFTQDFMTMANVNINSLKNAYVTVPDLRAAMLQLGLSFDLTWKEGLTFTVDIN